MIVLQVRLYGELCKRLFGYSWIVHDVISQQEFSDKWLAHEMRHQDRAAIFVLTIVPIDDTGGGARWTQLTLEFLRMQYMVFFINKLNYKSILFVIPIFSFLKR